MPKYLVTKYVKMTLPYLVTIEATSPQDAFAIVNTDWLARPNRLNWRATWKFEMIEPDAANVEIRDAADKLLLRKELE